MRPASFLSCCSLIFSCLQQGPCQPECTLVAEALNLPNIDIAPDPLPIRYASISPSYPTVSLKGDCFLFQEYQISTCIEQRRATCSCALHMSCFAVSRSVKATALALSLLFACVCTLKLILHVSESQNMRGAG